ncbi:amidohydrolase family protein [Sphingomicrobium astaxanthinifaciens]|uniref:amidohydrolase family protein n=1 Tax=Sphingomicrobium astaxanthinifaciens TaxID=1227949 RepID=UPI001FCA8989|nr:amidohydrolase family protein [Sphingomicrobium astaxanthinifaciens]MCJ7420760.1 amidohydrolase family protein [Sphingomicrobium astaxanthinifaciens]
MKTLLSLLASTALVAAPAWAQDEHGHSHDPVIVPEAVAEAPESESSDWDVTELRGPGEMVPLDTSEGTWISLDISPDGTEIVFDLLGDLYLLPIGGGEARPIATGHQWDMQPVFSPDGSEIAFTSDRGGGDNLWVMKRDGSEPRQVSDESFRLLNQPAWTPDGEFIVGRKHFTSDRSLGAGEMWLYHKSGVGGGVQMTEKRTDQKDTGEPAFSPDGRYLYYSDDATPGDTFEYSKDVNGQIYVIRRLDRETGEIETLVSGAGGAIRPTPSPDGKSLAFIRRVRGKTVLMRMELESGRITPLTDMLDRDMQETWAVHGVYPHIAWTPDSQDIIFWAKGGIHRIDTATRAVSEIPFRVQGERWVADAVRHEKRIGDPTFETRALRFTTMSPAGDRIVFEALGRLYLRDLASGATRPLTRPTDAFQSYPVFSRDGRQLAWVEWDDEALSRIMLARADGSRARALDLPRGHYVEPAFSPDGRSIAYRRTGGGYLTSPLYSREPGLYVVDLSGGEPQRVAPGGTRPQFGADPDRLFYLTQRDDKSILQSVRLDTRERQDHFSSAFAADFELSPDGTFVAWTERFQTYVIPVPMTGRPVELSPEGKALPQARVTKDVGDWVHWSGDGKTLYWSQGPTLYGRTLARIDDLKAPEDEADAVEPTRIADLAMTVEAGLSDERYVLSGARIVTMRGDEVIEQGAIMVADGRIAAVGPLAAMSWPRDTRVIDVTGKTIIPGLIDAHWHGPMGAGLVIPQQNWAHAASLAHGVTTVHDPSNNSYTVFAAGEYQRAGRIIAPRIFSTGTILYGATTGFTAAIDDKEDALSHLRRLRSIGAWSVKSYNQPRRDQRQMVIEAAREVGMDVVPEGGSLFQHNMTMVADGHTTIEHALPVQVIYDDVKQFWGGKEAPKTAYTPTLNVAYGGPWGEMWWYQTTPVWADPVLNKWVPRGLLDAASRRGTFFPEEENNLAQVAEAAAQLEALGVLTNIGAHGQREGLGAHWEIWSFALGGMSNHDALRSATIYPARTLGLASDLGSIEPGKLADLVILEANPLVDIRQSASVAMVMQDGKLYDRDLQVVAGGSGGLDPFWFQTDAGSAYSMSSAQTEGSHQH